MRSERLPRLGWLAATVTALLAVAWSMVADWLRQLFEHDPIHH